MSHPIFVALAAVLAVLDAGAAYFLVRGLRDGRFAYRFTILLQQRGLGITPDRQDREPGYSYRDRDPVGFWYGAVVQAAAVIVCTIMVVTLMTAP